MSGSKLLIMSVCLFAFFSLCPTVFAEKVVYEYDDYGRLTKTTLDDGYYTTHFNYGYDNVGNFTNDSITKLLNPKITASPQPVDFSVVYSGSESNQIITVSNTGGDGLSVTNLDISGIDKALFTVTSNGCNDVILAAGGTCTIQVTAAPISTTATGAKTATLVIASNDTINPTQSVAINATVSRPTLTITKQGGTGVVTSAPEGISCGGICSTTFPSPTSVTLTAVPDLGTIFLSWSGACSGTSPSCNVSVSQTSNVTAIFKDNQSFAVNLTVTGSGSGSVLSTPSGIAGNTSNSASFPAGTKVTLQTTAAQYSIFSGWTSGACSGTADCLLTMNADKSVTATFDKDVARQVAIGSPPTYYSSVQAAYNAGINGDVIKLWAQPYNENLVCNLPIEITIQGGYDSSYTTITAEATIQGSLTIVDGGVIADGLTIQ